jgi:hypothetical protein
MTRWRSGCVVGEVSYVIDWTNRVLWYGMSVVGCWLLEDEVVEGFCLAHYIPPFLSSRACRETPLLCLLTAATTLNAHCDCVPVRVWF